MPMTCYPNSYSKSNSNASQTGMSYTDNSKTSNGTTVSQTSRCINDFPVYNSSEEKQFQPCILAPIKQTDVE